MGVRTSRTQDELRSIRRPPEAAPTCARVCGNDLGTEDELGQSFARAGMFG